MTPDLDALKRLCEQATPGPWAVRPSYHDGEDFEDVISHGHGNLNVCADCSPDTTDAELIATARTEMPALIAEVERLLKVAEAALAVRDKTISCYIVHPSLTGKCLVPIELADALNVEIEAWKKWRTP